MGRFDLSTIQLVDPPEDHRDKERSRIQIDDILITIVGAKTGDVCRVDRILEDHFVCQSVALVRPALSPISKYLESFLCARSGGQAHFRKFTYGQGRPHLGFEQIESTPVPLPPLAEQDRMVAEIERITTMAGHIELSGGASSAKCHTLRQSLLKHAFSGKLVPQDPADEPASVLLERIRAQRAKLEGGTAPRKRAVRKTKKSS